MATHSAETPSGSLRTWTDESAARRPGKPGLWPQDVSWILNCTGVQRWEWKVIDVDGAVMASGEADSQSAAIRAVRLSAGLPR